MVQKMKELLLFQVGAMQLGMDLSSVRSIQSAPGIASKPLEKHNRFAPLTEDQDVLLYNLLTILGDENSSANSENEKLIMVNAQDRMVGLIVERVNRVVKMDNDRIEPLSPIFQGPALSCFPRVLKHEDRLVLLLDPQAMVDMAQQMQKSQDVREGLDLKNNDGSPSEVKSADTVISRDDTEVTLNSFFAKYDYSEQDELPKTELPKSNTIFSAKEPDPVIQQSTPAEVVYTECDEIGMNPKPHMNFGRSE
jgi:purine-binding chemotaxis protein CheW